MKIFYYVKNLIGIGHIVRSLNIAKELTDAQITFVTGGIDFTIPNYSHIHQVKLPGLKMNQDMEVVSADDVTPLDELKARRKQTLKNYFSMANYDVIITEQFPFGGHSLKEEIFEILHLNARKSKPGLVISSVRDILSPDMTGEERDVKTISYLNRYYDRVLVHSDEKILPLEKTFHSTEKIKHLLSYTGFVVEKHDSLESNPSFIPTVVFGMGGSDRGFEFLNTVLLTSNALQSNNEHHKLIVYLGKYGEHEFDKYADLVKNDSHIEIRRFDNSFITELKKTHVYVGLAGYNTMMDLLQIGTPGIIYPYTNRHEPDLRLRTLNLEDQFDILDRSNICISTLYNKIRYRLCKFERYNSPLDFRGAQKSAQLIRDWYNKK